MTYESRPRVVRSARLAFRFVSTLVFFCLITHTALAKQTGESSAAQGSEEAQWENLMAQVQQLLLRDAVAEAVPLAQRAEEVANKAFGLESTNTALSMMVLVGI